MFSSNGEELGWRKKFHSIRLQFALGFEAFDSLNYLSLKQRKNN